MAKKRKRSATEGHAGVARPLKQVRVEGAAEVASERLPPYPHGFPLEPPKGDALNAYMQLDFKGTVHLVNRANDMVEWSRLESARVLGMDTETQPAFTKGAPRYATAILQLATEDECWIFQLLSPFGVSNETKERLRALLESPSPVKVGVGIRDDYRELSEFYFPSMEKAAGILDLQDIVRPYRLKSTSLRALAAIFLCRRIAKGQQISNWGNEKLHDKQLWYAAVDAWAGWRLHETLRSLFEGSDLWAPPLSLTITSIPAQAGRVA